MKKIDAVEFIKEYFRLCEAHEDCVDCPFTKEETDVPCDLISKNAEKIVSIVEQWSQAHPQKTMIQDFFEKFPNAPKTTKDLPRNICPSDCRYTNEPPDTSVCNKFDGDCLKCWSRPLEE